MAFNLVETINYFISSDVLPKVTSHLNENESQLRKALSATIPSVLTTILHKAAHGNSSLASVFNLAKDVETTNITSHISAIASRTGSTSITTNIFGDKLGNVTSAIANYAGIKQSSASSLLNIATPATLGVVGRYASNNSLSANGLLAMLVSQKDKILSAVPSGFPLAGALGLGSLEDISNKLSSSFSAVSREVKKPMPYLPALILVLLAGIILWALLRNQEPTVKAELTESVASPAIDPPNNTERPASINVQLPNGTTLVAYKGGIEDKLVTFLNDPSSATGKDIWFDFDNLNFETGSAEITPASQMQINNIAAILKAYPNLKIKIGGYTDKTGNEEINKTLSQQRADAVVDALKAAGSSASQVTEAEGYGSSFAKMPADASEEERKIDRRIAISVREK